MDAGHGEVGPAGAGTVGELLSTELADVGSVAIEAKGADPEVEAEAEVDAAAKDVVELVKTFPVEPVLV